METLRRIFLVAGLAGLLCGVLVTVAHMLGTVPIILKAEVYEDAADKAAPPATAEAPMAMAHDHMAMDHDHGEHEWQPQDGLQRTSLTALADILTAIGFALLLVSAYVVRGQPVDWRQGLFWGLAGFATFSLAPALGLPPEVPGTEAAPLLDRQVWWLATALATGSGLALIFMTQKTAWMIAGAVVMVLPHLYGAPQPAEYASAAPEALAHEFVVAALVTSLLFWVGLGLSTGFLFDRLGRSASGRYGTSLAEGLR